MHGEREPIANDESRAADRVYEQPSAANETAKSTVADAQASNAERSGALAALGRIAYYDNRITDAVALLEECLALTDDPSLKAETALTLAPALSKQGRSREAMELLESDHIGITDELQGKAHNQRGSILVELGRLPAALESFRLAREIHRRCGYEAGEGRALLNMGAAASEIGDQAQAEHWYEEAWRINRKAGLHVMCAMIEGNLGYVKSRRGDFSAAVAWYSRARKSFADLGDMELAVAVLEVDHATTLLDLGLHNAARLAAEFALRSSAEGGNRLLAMQSELLLGEAHLNLRHHVEARRMLESARTAAKELRLEPWTLRCDQLLLRILVEAPAATAPLLVSDAISLAEGMRVAGWHRDALRVVASTAHALAAIGDNSGALELLKSANLIDRFRADPIDHCHTEALAGLITGDAVALDAALKRGFVEIDRQRQLLSSAELRSRIGHRASDLREIALGVPLRDADAARVLTVDQQSRAWASASYASSEVTELRALLRDLRVSEQEARLNGGNGDESFLRARQLDKDLSALLPLGTDTHLSIEASDIASLGADVVCITYIDYRERLLAIVADRGFRLVELGATTQVERAARSQRMALRQMAGGTSDSNQGLLEAANRGLDDLLIAPLRLRPDQRVVVVPDRAVTGVSWSGIPSLTNRELALTPSLQKLLSAADGIEVGSAALLDGGSLNYGSVDALVLGELWRNEGFDPAMVLDATKRQALNAFSSADLLHVAAHGSFRSDNPFFSSMEFSDGPMMVIDLERAETLPSLVILASCATSAAISVGDELVGTSDAFLAQGARAVIAPTVLVDDAATHCYALDLHRALLDGHSITRSVRMARMAALNRGTAPDVAVAQAFQVHGDRGVLAPLKLSGIRTG